MLFNWWDIWMIDTLFVFTAHRIQLVRCRPRGQYQPALSRDPVLDQRRTPLQPPTLIPLHASKKFADDTYLVVPTECADSRAAELTRPHWSVGGQEQFAVKQTQDEGSRTSMTAVGVTVSSHRRCCRTSTATLRWKSLASPSAETCQRRNTSAV